MRTSSTSSLTPQHKGILGVSTMEKKTQRWALMKCLFYLATEILGIPQNILEVAREKDTWTTELKARVET